MKKCPVCKNTIWLPFYSSNRGRLMTSDHRILSGNLNKVSCKTCGLVTNEKEFTSEELESFYEDDYQLNTKGHEEHIYFTKDGPIARSEAYVDWIEPHIPENAKSIFEIGCGEGMFLGKIKERNPNVSCFGIDGSKKATELAKDKGLDVAQLLVVEGVESTRNSDVIILNGVIEHIQNLPLLFNYIKGTVNHSGRVIFTLPILDESSYDLFLHDHVWHFTTNKFLELLRVNGFSVIHSDDSNHIVHGFGLFVCELCSSTNTTVSNAYDTNYQDIACRASRKWIDIFSRLNNRLNNSEHESIAIFGGGEVFTLLMAYTELGQKRIEICIDETDSLVGTKKNSILISDLSWLEDNKVDLIILAINEKYYGIVESKLSNFNLDIFRLS